MESGRLSDGKTLCPRSAALDAVTGVLQDGERFFKVFFLQEDIVRVKGGDRENADAVIQFLTISDSYSRPNP